MASFHFGNTYSRKRARRRLQQQQKQLDNKKELQLHDLPSEILRDILSRLPITSLAQAKYTCKLWHTMINDALFPELHLTHAVKNPGHLYSLTGNDLNLCFAEKALDRTVAIKFPTQVADNILLGDYTLYSNKRCSSQYPQYISCHGLICYCPIVGDIYVFNPIIGEHVRLPSPRYKTKFAFGFGYSPVSRKYKCYCCSYDILEGQNLMIDTEIYTLGDESWREIKGLPRGISSYVYSKGAMHWKIGIARVRDVFHQFEPGDRVVSLDLETEKIRKRRVNCSYEVCQSYLRLIGETIAMVLHLKETIKILMLVDEDNDVWVQMYDISFGMSNELKPDHRFQVFGLWMNQELCCMSGTDLNKLKPFDMRLLSYSVDQDLFNTVQLPFAEDENGDEISARLVITHAGSLVSPLKVMDANKQQPSVLA